MSVTSLAETQPVSRPAVSQHLKVLETANMVSATRHGNQRVYELRRDGFEDLRAYLNEFWDDVLIAYGAEVTRRALRIGEPDA